MEIQSKNGFKIRLQEDIDFGRGLGFNSTDRTVSRRHISFRLHEDGTRVSFQVKGKNPIWVRDCTNDDIRVYKSSERGKLKIGDSFCVSSKNPVWFNLKRIEREDEEDDESNSGIRYDEAFAEISGIDHDEIETGEVSDIDPVKEFNFVVMGHEFDCYPKKLIRDLRNWNWFLEEPNKDSDEEDENSEKKSKKVVIKKRKKGGSGDDDDVWTDESEEDVELIKKSRNDLKPKYSTRSKDKNRKGAGASKSVKDNAKAMSDDEEVEDDDEEEEDETLGGFIIDDEDIGEGNEEDDEEEEFEEDE
ncbi:hypothetical protein L1987_53842 [Smallanthus sonchifolius]|uniref:Uncharacterized protein n=1 Tax=Smallanthus sonchifolius TaxID=185202 RepID=A0ACB9EXN2_9ASTR|nr:hypothetical protein L1987_53842 [Smallanthus sonchifolius]